MSLESDDLSREQPPPRKLAEAALQQNEGRFRSLFDAMHEGFAFHEVICNDQGEVTDYRYLDINPAFEQLTGLKRETTVGRTVRELLPGIEEEWIRTFGRVAMTGEPAELENYVKDLGRYYRARAYSPQRGTFAVVFEEITDQQRAKTELEEREARLRVLFDSSYAGIILVDPSRRITFANRRMAEMFGCTLEELIGTDYLEHVHPDQRGTGDERMKKLIQGEIDFVGTERHYVRRDGSDFWGFLSGKRHEDADGGLLSLVGHITDITDLKHAEGALREKEQYLQTIIDASPECIKLLDRDGTVIMMNRSGLRMIEAESLAQVQGQPIYSLVVERDRNGFMALTERVFNGEQGTFEFEAVGLHGRPVLLETHAVPFRSAGNEIIALLGITRDVTARKQVEHDLHASQEFLASILENIPNMIFVKDAKELRFVRFNRAGESLLGIPREELIGRNDYDFFPKEEADFFTARDREVLESGTVLDIPEETIHTKNGPRILHTRKIGIQDAEGNLRYLIGISEDITERKRSEESLREHQEMISAIVESSRDWIWAIDINGHHTYSNQAVDQILGYSPIEFQGMELDLVHPEDRSIVAAKWPGWVAAKQGWRNLVLRWQARDGSYRYLESTAVPILGSDGELLGFRGVDRDITERKQAEEDRHRLEQQLLHAQKLESLGVLAGGIAHDFNNILTAIIGNADLALMRLAPESPAQENLHRIEKAAARAADLARQMLAYSGKGKFVVEAIDLNRLVEEMGHMLEVSISKKALLRFNLTRPLPPVNADATQIRQIIMNLVINASEAIGDRSGVIALTTGCLDCTADYLKGAWLTDPIPAGLYVSLEIADTGCGMDKETLEKIFDPFFTTKFTGRGLGMAAVLGIVRGHRGAIKVYSEPGRGTTFKVMLPAGDKPVELFNDKADPDSWRGSGVALLVDDEETVRAIGGEMLQELGFEVITAGDGREALDLFRSRSNISVVILDLTMPRMDGEQCFRELRQLDPTVKVIMSSGFSESEVIHKFAGKGIAGFVQKPYKLSSFRNVLKELIPR